MKQQPPEPDRFDFINVASSSEMTGLEPTPPLTGDEEDAYAELGNAGAPGGICMPCSMLLDVRVDAVNPARDGARREKRR